MTYRVSDQYELILKEVKTKKAKIKKRRKKNLYLMTYWRLRTWTPTQRNVPTFCQRGTSLSEIWKRNQRVMNKTTKKPIHRIHFLFFYSQKFQTKKFRYTFNRKNVFGMDARKKLSTEISRRGTDSSQENICSYKNCIKKSLVPWKLS